jgi:hypothetical protein
MQAEKAINKKIITRSIGGRHEKIINDALFEAVEELDRCLSDKAFDHIIDDELRTEIQDLRDRMERMRIKLNTPFHHEGPGRSIIEVRGEINVA